MKFVLAIAALALTVVLVKADTCFDLAIGDRPFSKRMAREKRFLKDGTFDVEGFTAEVKRVVRAAKLDAVTKILTECGDDAKADREKYPSVNGPLLFHICYKLKIDEECSDSLQWDD